MTDIEEIKRCLTHIARSKDSVSDLLPVLIKNITPHHNSMDFQFDKPISKLKTPTKISSMNVLEMRQNIIYDDIKDIRKEVESLRETVTNINSVVSILLSMNKPVPAQQTQVIPMQPLSNSTANAVKPIVPPQTKVLKSPVVKDTKISNNLANFTSNPQNLEISKQLGLTATKGSTTLQFEKPIQLICWLKKYVPEGLYPKYTTFLSCVSQYNSLLDSEPVPEHLTWLLDWKLLPKSDLNFLFKLINDHFASSISNGKKGQTSIQEVNIPKMSENKELKPTEPIAESKTVEEDHVKDMGSKKSKFSNMWSDFRRRIYKKRKEVTSSNRMMPSISSTFISKHRSLENPKKRPRSSSSINLGSNQTIHNIGANYKKFRSKEESLASDDENEFVFSKPSSEEDKTGKYIGEVVAGLTEGLYANVDLSVWTKCLELSLSNNLSCLNSLKNNSLYNGYLSLYFPSVAYQNDCKPNCLNTIVWDRLSSHQRIFFLELLFIIIKVSDGLPDNVQSYFDSILPPYDKVVEKIKIFMVTFGCDSLENLGTKVGSELTKSYSEPSISLVLSLLLDCLKIDFELPENSKAINYMGPVFRKFRFTSITQSITPFVELVVDILNSDSVDKLIKFTECSHDDLNELYSNIKEALKTAERNFYAAIDSSFDSDNENNQNKENQENRENLENKENVDSFQLQKTINRSSSVNKRKILQPQKIL